MKSLLLVSLLFLVILGPVVPTTAPINTMLYDCTFESGYVKNAYRLKGRYTEKQCIAACIEKKKLNDDIDTVIRKTAKGRIGCWCGLSSSGMIDNKRYKRCVLERNSNGDWGEWSDYGGCSLTCGGGQQERHRSCNYPSTADKGLACLLSDGSDSRSDKETESKDCNDGTCPANGDWGEWSSYGGCSLTCGGGQKERYRLCNSPSPADGGLECLLSDGSGSRSDKETESSNCNDESCPVNGNWGEWSDYGGCSVTCGGGTKGRKRLCNSPSPAHGGLECLLTDGGDLRSNEETESTDCNDQSCPGGPYVIGTDARFYYLYTEGKSWSEAQKQCELDGAHLAIDNNGHSHVYIMNFFGNVPMWIGGTDQGHEGTWTWVDGRTVENNYWGNDKPNGGIHANCMSTNQLAAGTWSDNACENKLPFLCQKEPQCPEKYPYAFNAGFQCCQKPREGINTALGRDCDGGAISQSSRCCEDVFVNCPMILCVNHKTVNSNWGDWSDYGECSSTCGGGQQERTRSCNNPSPVGSSPDCLSSDGSYVGSKELKETKACNTGLCPVNGGFSEWIHGTCSLPCGGGVRTEMRTCNNPAPLHGGEECHGDFSRTQACNEQHCVISTTNFAKFKATSQSSFRHPDYQAVDGRFDSISSTQHSGDEWWMIDLGDTVNIMEIKMYAWDGRGADLKHSQLSIGMTDNPPDMKLLATFDSTPTQQNNGYYAYVLKFNTPEKGRYLRVVMGPQTFLAIREFEVYLLDEAI